MAKTGTDAAVEGAATEDWFLHRGVPHLIVDYSPSRGILTRAAPLLSVVFVAELSLFSVFLFLNAEMWKVAAELPALPAARPLPSVLATRSQRCPCTAGSDSM